MKKRTIQRLQQRLATIGLAALTVFCFGATGEICGPFFDTTADAFEARFPENNPKDIRAIKKQVASEDSTAGITNRSGNPLAVFSVNEPAQALVAWDLKTQKELWRKEMAINSRLVFKADTIILQSGYKVAGVSAGDGSVLWERELEEGWDYYGADVCKQVAVITMGIGTIEGGYSNGRIIAVDTRTGKKLWDNTTGSGLLGAPSAYGDNVFVPWKRNQVAILDLATGTETARILASDFTINFVKAISGGIYYGTAGTDERVASLFKLDDGSAKGTRADATGYTPPIPPVPNSPGFAADAFRKPAPGLSPSDRIRFYWLPEDNAGLSFTDNRYYLHYWRYVIAFDATTGAVQWTHIAPEDLHAIQVAPGGLFSMSARGDVGFLSADTGNNLWTMKTKNKPVSIAFDVQGFHPASDNSPDRPDPRAGLKEIIQDNDNRMLPFRIYAAGLLAGLDIPEVTRDLLEIYSDATLSTSLQIALKEEIQNRESGSEYLREALAMNYDFLDRTQAPPMGVIAPSLARMADVDALGGLMTHLQDYETPTENIEPIAAAMLEVGNESVVAPLAEFAMLYHADSSFIGHEDALARVCEVILKFGKEKGETLVAEIRDNSQTLPELKKLLLNMLDPDAEAKALAAAEQKKRDEQARKKAAAEQKKKDAFANRPDSLSRRQIRSVMGRHASVLRPCIKDALQRRLSLNQVRMTFSIDGTTGVASGLKVIPADIPDLEECLNNAMTKITFPPFKNTRQSASHTIRITGVKRPPKSDD